MRRFVRPMALSVIAAWQPTSAFAQTMYTSPVALGPTAAVGGQNTFTISSLPPGDWFAAGFYQDYVNGTALGLTISNASVAVNLNGLSSIVVPMQAIYQFSSNTYAGSQPGRISTSISNSSIGVTFEPSGMLTGNYSVTGVNLETGGSNGASSSAGAAAGGIDFNLSNSTITVNATVAGQGAAVGVLSQGGAGGTGQEKSAGGLGGTAGAITGVVSDVTLYGTGQGVGGLVVSQIGGAGGNGLANEQFSSGGAGANASGMYTLFSSSGPGSSIMTSGDSAPGIAMLASGGNGGIGSDHDGELSINETGSYGGNGGSVLSIADPTGASNSISFRSCSPNLSCTGPLSITTSGQNAYGIQLAATAGNGGNSGKISAMGGLSPGIPGAGGTTGSVSLELFPNATIKTTGSGASAILAQAQGGNGGTSGGVYQDSGNASTAPGGQGGTGGNVWIYLHNQVGLSTTGASADGVTARSVGGLGGSVGEAAGGIGVANGANGGNGGGAIGINITSAATISTTGSTSRGILAQAISGMGGNGGDTGALFSSQSGGPGVSGSVGEIQLTNSGAITTAGSYSQGILAQSISGGGGAGGSATGSLFYDQGGGGAENSNAGVILLTNSGSITTSGEAAMAIVGQSVGGGGGMGGTAGGVFYSAAGQGGMGGAGGNVTFTLSGTLVTHGSLAHGAVAQSIGGGGGAGGNSYSNSAAVTYNVGGAGGSGGVGGAVALNATDFSTTTGGAGAIGLVAQSVGGGGGSGGAGYATSVGAAFSAAASLGGSGGSGGAGGSASATLTNSSIKTGVGGNAFDAHGVVVQSIGGGGGNGGGASANAVATSMPIPAEAGPSSSFTITAAYAVGGSGGNGGSASNASLAINGSTISTLGDGAHGAVVQSIGGGGGNGGDSSAMTASFGYGFTQVLPDDTISSQSVSATLAVGGACTSGSSCSGGNGASAQFTLGRGNGSPAPAITTTGHLAGGVVVQSVGGGGGNAGVGNARTNSYGIDSTYSLTMNIGAQGGSGGNGGSASASTTSSGSISTSGESAPGLVVQSIGGGGGIGSGGSGSVEGLLNWAQSVVDGGGSELPSIKLNPNVNVGAKNGSGGSAGSAYVSQYAAITTRGNDAPGTVAQSIGGGGGIGGSAGTPTSVYLSPPTSSGWNAVPSVDVNLRLNVGGNAISGGNAGTVTVTHGGTTATSGDYSNGVLAQSIGGGGGRGAVAYVNNQSQNAMAGLVTSTIGAKVLVGGQSAASSGRLGGAVTVRLDGGRISTGAANGAQPASGFQSYGILAQSISGGGGTGVDASFDPNGEYALGGNNLGTVREDSNGFLVRVETSGVPTSITTTGQAGHGVVAQSIGAGGGIIGIGSSANPGHYSGTMQIDLGGAGSYGDGGPVNLSPPDVTTSGAGAFGILAQSIGGGGGIVETSSGGAITLAKIGTLSGGGDGGAVSVFPRSIATSGVGSHGIVAQSIGGGGGLFSNYRTGQIPALTTTMPVPGSLFSYGNGGPVTVATSTDVVVTGAGAFGILAQSIGGGGGLVAANGVVYAGSTSGSSSPYLGGAVTITAQGSVTASGDNGIGIFAQSDGPGGGSDISIALGANTPGVVPGGFVSGGSGAQGAGIVLAGGRNNLVTVGQGSWVWAASGTAIRQVGSRPVNVANYGTVYGDTWLNGGSFTTGYQVGGSPSTATAGTLTNFAVIAPMPGQRSIIDGHLVQAASGRIAPHLDYSNSRSGSYLVTGNASLAGSIQPTLATAMPNIFLPVLQVAGTATGALTAPDSPLFSYTLRDTAQKYDIAITGAHFNAPRFGLSAHQTGLANALQSMFLQGKPQLGAFYAGLDSVAGQGAAPYRNALTNLAPRSAMTLFSHASANATRIADASMSCPKFGGAGVGVGAHAFLTEGECAYVTTRGQRATLRGDQDRGRASLDSAAWQIGGQGKIGEGLLLGGSLAYQADWFSGRDGVSAQGASLQGAVTLKYQTGPWLLTGALFGSFGEYEVKRRVMAPTLAAIAGADAGFYAAGLRARIAYTFGGESFYVRPYLNLDLVHSRNGSFAESGIGELGLRVDGGPYNTAILTPAIEFGSRLDLSNGMVLRSFVSAGLSLRSNDTWKGYAGFNGDFSRQRFAMNAALDQTAARVSAGLQLFRNKAIDVRLQYDGEYGSETIKHGATASFSYRF